MTRTSALLVVLVFLALSAGYADVRVFQLSGSVASNQRSDTRALCSFKADLQKRVDSTVRFLATHPNGIPGIPAATLRINVKGQQATLRSLSPLRC